MGVNVGFEYCLCCIVCVWIVGVGFVVVGVGVVGIGFGVIGVWVMCVGFG